MSLFFNKEEEYTSPLCRVYSVNLEGAIANTSGGAGGNEVPPVEEEDEGTY